MTGAIQNKICRVLLLILTTIIPPYSQVGRVFGFQHEGHGLKPQDQLVMLLAENALHLSWKWGSFHLLLNIGIVLVMTLRNTVRLMDCHYVTEIKLKQP